MAHALTRAWDGGAPEPADVGEGVKPQANAGASRRKHASGKTGWTVTDEA